jgi:ketosteroid isomerase-like protein
VTDRVAAELEIRNILARLAHLADRGETDTYVALLTDDIVWAMPANPTIGLAASERRGRDEIARGQRERMAAGHQGPGSNTMHVVTTIAVDVAPDGDLALAESSFQYWGDTATAPAIRNMGRYRDELRRTPDGWKLARRSISFG